MILTRALAGALAAALLGAGVQSWRLAAAHDEVAGLKLQAASDEAARANAAAADAAHRAEVARDAQIQIQRARADAAAARGAADGLRQRAQAYAADCPASAAGAASAPGVVLADMLGSAAGRAVELAAVVDELDAFARACERAQVRP